MDRKKPGIAGGLILLVCIGICAGISDLSLLEQFDEPLNTERFLEIGDILAAGTE